ncbi:MAG: hypothetical protein IJW99_05075 [Clostridia bacterium]|nr:hypothetical protein [Clostridia bacterium]
MTTTKRLLALLLCLVMLISCLAACGSSTDDSKKDDEDEENVDKGAYIKMYLADEVFDFDPAYVFNNESAAKIISLMYEPLFTLTANGKVEKALVKSYKIFRDANSEEYKMTINLKKTFWSDGTYVSADDVVYAWKRILEVENSSEAAYLLYDIKNARAVKEGEMSIDDLGIYAVDDLVLEITFEGDIDYDQFLVNLTSYALVPLREDIVSRNDDWSKKPATITCSGPFTLRSVSYADEDKGLTLERNQYYMRDRSKNDLLKFVTPYRLIVDYTKTADEIMQSYANGEIFYVGEIPFSVRASYADQAEITDALSTHVYYLNENAMIDDGTLQEVEAKDAEGNPIVDENNKPVMVWEGGEKLFANATVRQALSLAIDREAIAQAVVFAKAATALVPPAAMEGYDVKTLFRTAGKDLLATSADVAAAKSLLSSAGIDATKYTFSITVRESDEAHMKIAEMVQAAWASLGFNVNLDVAGVIVNDDMNTATEEVAKDIRDDMYNEKLYGINGQTFEVIAVDAFATNGGASSMLVPFAKQFAGQAMDMSTLDYIVSPHMTGYDSEEYNNVLEEYHATKDIAKKAELLHKAEEILMKDLPVIPIIYNQNAIMVSDDLSNVNPIFYQPAYFKKAKQKNYELYTETTAQ